MLLGILFWLSAVCLVLSWIGYPACIFLLVIMQKDNKFVKRNDLQSVSFIIAAFNEEALIKDRINNLRLLNGDYPLEIIIGSDGSTDNTAEKAISFGLPEVKVFSFRENRGRAMVHNDCAVKAEGDILIFTDAETMFEKDFLEKILPYFADPEVGAVSGRIVYRNENKSDIGRSAGLYWRYEERIRMSESKLSILGFGTGAALAMRKTAYTSIGATEDIDYAATLEAAAKGYRVIYEPAALAYDFISETAEGAFRTRVRQTSRCFKSVLNRIFSRQILLKRPSLFCAALMHKTFRHLTPFFMLAIFISNFFLINSGIVYYISLFLQLAFYILAASGFLTDDRVRGPLRHLLALPYNFVLLNIGRGVGVVVAIAGRDRATYQTRL